MQIHSKQLGRKLVQGTGKEESEPERSKRKILLMTFGKHYSPYLTWFQKLPITLLPPNNYSKIHDQPFPPSKSTERMRPLAFPTVESSIMELHLMPEAMISVFTLTHCSKVLQKQTNKQKKDNINEKTSPTSLQNTSG